MQDRPATGGAMQKRIAIHSSLEPLALPPHLSRTDGGDAKHPGVPPDGRLSVSENEGCDRLQNRENVARTSTQGRPGVVSALVAAGARAILPDMRGHGASDKPREKSAYENSAMARDVLALIEHLRLDSVDVIGFSMGAGTAARLLLLRPPQVKSAILAGFGDYAIEDHVMEFPKNWPVPDSVPRPITAKVWLEEGAK